MIRPKFAIATLMLALFAFFPNVSEGHSAFKKFLSTKFPNKKLSCDVCHIKGQKKDVQNAYGKLFVKVMNKPDLTKGWNELKGTEKKTYEKEVMVVEFEKAYNKISKMTFADLVKGDMIEGVKSSTPPAE